MKTRRERVLEALQENAIGDEVAMPLSELAAKTGISVAAAARNLRALVDTGDLEPAAGRFGKTRIFKISRIGEKPEISRRGNIPVISPDIGEKEARDGEKERRNETAEHPFPGISAFRPEEDEDYEPAPPEVALAHLYGFLGIGMPDLEPGDCGECGGFSSAGLYRFGVFELCRRCRERRAKAASRLDPSSDLQAALLAEL